MEKKECPHCGGTGFVDKGKTVVICSCRFDEKDMSKYLRIPPRFYDATFENYIPVSQAQRSALKVCLSYSMAFDLKDGRGLTLLGPPHMGKTHLAVAALKTVYKTKMVKGIFFDTKDMFFKLRSVMENGERYTRMMKVLLWAPLLVLDDLGSERLSDWQREIITHLISHRYNSMKSTIITTNYALRRMNEKEIAKTLEERLSEAVVSKISQMNTSVYLI